MYNNFNFFIFKKPCLVIFKKWTRVWKYNLPVFSFVLLEVLIHIAVLNYMLQTKFKDVLMRILLLIIATVESTDMCDKKTVFLAVSFTC